MREQQHEREKEQNSHGLMLRELQTLLTREKNAREQLEAQLEELRFEHDELQQTRVVSHDEAYEAQVKSLQTELQKSVARSVQTEADAKLLKENNDKLTKELHQMKVKSNGKVLL